MHRYFLIFEIGFFIAMVYFFGWWAGGAAAGFMILSAIANVSREEERNEKEVLQRFNYEKQVMESCQETYKKILDEVPGAANLIDGYYYDRDKENENFLIKHYKEKTKMGKSAK